MRAEPPHLGRQTALEACSDAEQRWREGCPVAIEVERSAKTPKRRPAILYTLLRIYDGIWYFCPHVLMEPMQKTLAQLDPAVRRKFALRPVP